MRAVASRAVAAARELAGASATTVVCSHGDVIGMILADALGMHLDLFQRIVVEPASVTVIRYTPTRPFLLRLGDTGDLRFEPAAGEPSEAVVGGGAGATRGGSVGA